MTEEIKYHYLKVHPLFEGLTEQQVKEVCTQAKVKTIYRNEIINYGSGSFSKLFFLIKGKIKLTEANELDEELVKDILTEGDIFGDLALKGMPAGDEFAEALTANTIICHFNLPDFRRILQTHPAVALNYAQKVSSKLKRLEDRHADLVFRDARFRLIRFIKNWARMDGNRVGDKIVLNNYLTHSDIARFISTSRQSVNVLFNELRDSGMLYYNRKQIELNDPMVWN